MQKKLRVNNQIRLPEVQLIDEKGKQLGVTKTYDALDMAKERELDLVEVGPNVRPPVAKIMDYGKYIYQKERKEKKSGVRQKDHDLKIVRIGFKTGPHDLKFKSGKAIQFLNKGNPVRLEVFLRGRERALAHIGKQQLEVFIKMIEEPYTIQTPLKRSPRGWAITIKKSS
jgi:translation initiation factor IF-3